MDEAPKEKKTRRKRRVPGTARPPRKSFSLRLEASTLERMDRMLATFRGSRNEYIERLIEFDLDYRERIDALNTPVTATTPKSGGEPAPD